MLRNTGRGPAGLALLGGLTLIVPSSVASPSDEPHFASNAFAGAATRHPASAVQNPGTVGLTLATTLYATTTLAIERTEIAGTNARMQDWAASPGLEFGGAWRLADRLAIALSAHAPAASIRATPNQPAFVYASNGARQRNYRATFTGAYRIGTRAFVGVSGGVGQRRFAYRFARDTALVAGQAGLDADCAGAPCGIANPLAAQYYALDLATDVLDTTEFTVGLVIRAGAHTHVGLAYHTPPGFGVTTRYTGRATIANAQRLGGGVLTGNAEVHIAYPAAADFEVRTELSEAWAIALAAQWYDTSRMAALDVRPYGQAFTEANIPNWIRRPAPATRDTFAFWLGASTIERGATWRVAARFGANTGGLPEAQASLATPGRAFGFASLATQVRLRPAWALEAQFSGAYMLPINGNGSAFRSQQQLDCIAAEYDFTMPACAALRAGYADFDHTGTLTHWQIAARVGLKYDY